MEIFNFNLTVPDEGGDQRKCVDARVIAMESGELKIIRVKKNESRVVAFDVMCLHRWVWHLDVLGVYLQCHVPTKDSLSLVNGP